jgi:hypothetical protein
MADSRGEADFHFATAETPSSGTRSSRSRMASAAECLRRPKGRLAGVIAHSDRLIRINRLLRAYLPPHLREHARIVAMTPEVWIIQTESSAWATRLRYLLPGLRKQLGDELKQSVPDLKLRIEPPSEPPPASPPRRLTLTEQNARVLEGAARDLSDQRLGAALLRLAQHAGQRGG